MMDVRYNKRKSRYIGYTINALRSPARLARVGTDRLPVV